MKKRKTSDMKEDAAEAKKGARSIANTFGGFLGKARDALTGKKDVEADPKSEDDMKEDSETALQDLRKSRASYKKRK